MNSETLNGKTIPESFEIFHADNPRIYELFKSYALRAIDANKKKASARMIIELIRWEYYIKTESDDGFKINNNFTPLYARKFIDDFPEYSELFNLRSAGADQIEICGADQPIKVNIINVDKDGQTTIF